MSEEANAAAIQSAEAEAAVSADVNNDVPVQRQKTDKQASPKGTVNKDNLNQSSALEAPLPQRNR